MNLILIFLSAFSLSIILTPLTIFFAKKYKFVDDPKKHLHPAIIHKRTVPRAGGVAIYLATFIAAIIFIPPTKQLIGIFTAGLVLIIAGLFDDKKDLGNLQKLFAQILAALIVVGSGVGISFITNPLLLFDSTGFGFGNVLPLDSWRIYFDFFGQHSIVILSDLFAVFWIVWVINMVNFSTGVDGQMPGIVVISLFVIFVASLRFAGADPAQITVLRLALIGSGATLGFLLFNFYPAKIFPGDSGSYFLGFLVAVCAILAGARVGAAVLVMAIPLIDGVFTIARRIASGNSPFVGDKKHLHHRLLTLGWGQRRIALFYWLLCAILGALALLLSSFIKIFAGVVVAIVVLGGLIWLNIYLPQRGRNS